MTNQDYDVCLVCGATAPMRHGGALCPHGHGPMMHAGPQNELDRRHTSSSSIRFQDLLYLDADIRVLRDRIEGLERSVHDICEILKRFEELVKRLDELERLVAGVHHYHLNRRS